MINLVDEKKKVARLSVISNSFLVVSKLFIGIFTGSISIISEAIHSGLDLVAALIAFYAVKNSSIPPDDEHKFGHGKIENISGFIEAILIFAAAIWIIYESVEKLIHPVNIENIWLGIAIMFVSSVINIYVSKKLFSVAHKTDSIALKADAMHLMTDVYTSAGVMFSLFVIWVMEFIFKGNHFHFLDPICAIVVAGLIMKAAYELTKESFGDLLDRSIGQKDISEIKNIINNNPEVVSFKNLKTRKGGNIKFIEFDVMLEKNISLQKAHQITDDITFKIKKSIANSNVTIHMEPCEDSCDDNECQTNCSKNNHNPS
ncbi:MAG TPA: cation diffusion facilitator family transporter [Elusimicrobiales bacterium]|nr:cation diffusion facilitator family transporter [Elusimicrobiales bacterium]HOL63641.1 cation diffusion facilitator family transporter [Elusimicrobiales bacterium]HPO95132.1 cation diffusion facilitator family transporter [Elusimicrobiales bacterium]